MVTKRALKRALLSSPSAVRDSVVVRWVFRTQERLETRFGKGRGDHFVAPDGHPMPPANLRVAISGIADAENHWNGGVQSKVALEALLASQGVSMSDFSRVLDFGAGAGRVLRQWQGQSEAELFGCDYNGEAVAWGRNNLRFANWSENRLEPPLPYPAEHFDLVYALSVFTHFPDPLQSAWMNEMTRVIRPGGWLIFTTMGNSFREQLTSTQHETFSQVGFVVHFPDSAGSNMCSAYHSVAYAHQLAGDAGFEAVASVEAGDDSLYPQDMHLVRRRA